MKISKTLPGNTRTASGVLALLAMLTVVGVACERTPTAPKTGTSTGTTAAPANVPVPTTPAKADNTKNNAANRDADVKTPLDQGNSRSDIDITAGIRRAIITDKAMSTNAQNCKIISEKGVVTLRGVVDSEAEKETIGATAKATTGVVSVDNQLEVKKPG